MVNCKYCDKSFGDEDDYHEHLRKTHSDELGPIDRRKVGADNTGLSLTGPLVLGVVLVISFAIVGYIVFASGGAGAGTADGEPSNVGSVHYHGTIGVVIDGERVDFSQPRYQMQADAFHFEGGESRRWHVHAQGVTLQWAMDSVGIDVTESSVTFEGETYNDADPGTNVIVEVNGNSVDPSEHVLQVDDDVRIIVEQS